ncbi:MAG: tryptophan-rich sensory protein [Clostridia bacterium]|nr:tryptophan-rich sensory protein [Clostridia bacterium]
MKFCEIKRRVQTELACIRPVTLGVSAGVCVLLGAIFAVSLVGKPSCVLLPNAALPSFLGVLLQFIAYALFGAAFGILLGMPFYGENTRALHMQKRWALVLFSCLLVLCYAWTPVVCKAGSFLLGALLCGVILLGVAVLLLFVHRISLLCAAALVLFALWVVYLLYFTVLLLAFF